MIFNQNIILLLAFALLNLVAGHPHPHHKRNIIFMVPDGMSPSAEVVARTYQQVRDELPIDHLLYIDDHRIGTVRTRSDSSLITDSAAAGTAFATGFKTTNGIISMSPDKLKKGTILEALHLMGYKTGLVTSTRVTHATPAVFAAHVEDRDEEARIAEQMLFENPFGSVVDLIMGGGKCYFTPQSEEESCREDSRNLITEAKNSGWSYVDTKEDLNELNPKDISLPFLGLFSQSHIPYVIDQDPKKDVNVDEQTKFSLNALAEATKDSEKGFFIMIESGRIDHCGHDNDPACHTNELLDYDNAFNTAKQFVDETDTDTILVSIADHGTGGIASAYNDDASWYPEVLVNKTHSSEYFLDEVTIFNETNPDNETLANYITDYVEKSLNIEDMTDEELSKIMGEVLIGGDVIHAMSALTSTRSAIGWTTGGHSNCDVNVFAYSNSKHLMEEVYKTDPVEGLAGNHENTEVPKFFAKLAGADLEEVTEKFNQ